ncbi:hypothetical protein BLA24064_04814 [Burkholderia latens]|uniref:Uncharacterized protein n=1 Tax=Burkholderia latens TaxID=488446 RepID=A0A6P2NZT7_9BURK|nr:hypothetical protein BLA24064_04814 [Burkholderia latens]
MRAAGCRRRPQASLDAKSHAAPHVEEPRAAPRVTGGK